MKGYFDARGGGGKERKKRKFLVCFNKKKKKTVKSIKRYFILDQLSCAKKL